jgi:hypothetical protein
MYGLVTRSLVAVLAACARMRQQLTPKRFLLVFLTMFTAACGPEADVTLSSLASPKPPVAPANVSGRVADASTGADIVGATLSMEAAPVETYTGTIFPPPVTDTSDANGLFDLLEVRASGSALLRVTAPGYMDAYVVVNAVSSFTAYVLVEMLPVAATTSVDLAAGGTATVPGSSGQVTIPGNSVEQEDGGAATGPLTVSTTPINMSQELNAAPGDFTNAAGEPLETWGGFTVTAVDATGADAQLAAGQTATIRIPYSTRTTTAAPANLALYYFDTETGKWVDSGATAALGGTAPNQYYEGVIDRFGTWMAGTEVTPVSYVRGCVENEVGGARVANVRVSAEGIDYSGISSAITDSSGSFRVAVKADSSLIVNGGLGNYLTNTLATSAPAAAGAETVMSECLVLAALSGAPRITLTWGESPSDNDSHLFAPDGTHVLWSSKGSLITDPYAALDVDDTTGYGPEVITLRRLMVGTYTYGVRNFGQDSNPGITDSPTIVELRRGLEVQRFRPGPGENAPTTEWWTVFQMVVDAQCNVTVTELNVWGDGGDSGPDVPVRPAPVARTYCTPP